MIDFSDILNNCPLPNSPKPEKQPPKPEKDRFFNIDFSETMHPDKAKEKNSKSFCEEKKSAPSRIDKQLYQDALEVSGKLLDKNQEITQELIDQVRQIVNECCQYACSGKQELLEMIFGKNEFKDKPYCQLNLVNVCILCLELGVSLNLDKDKLIRLGCAGFLHDIGMRQFQDLVYQPRRLTLDETQSLKSHTELAPEIKTLIEQNFGQETVVAINQEHERYNAKGYPHGLKADDISQASQIIGLVDVYEALSHWRPYRERYTSIEAMKILMRDKPMFNPNLLKLFLEKIGLYPRGVLVELNTKEVALVIGQNFRIPSCPIVKVIYDSHGREIAAAREINLSLGAKIYITRGL